MRMTLFCLGKTGVRLGKIAMMQCMSGVWQMDALCLFLVGVEKQETEEMMHLARDYAQVRGAYGLGRHDGFLTAIQCVHWPEEGAQADFQKLSTSRMDREIASALFPQDTVRRRSMDATLTHAELFFAQCEMQGFGQAVEDVLHDMQARDDLLLMLCGSLCEHVGSAGMPALARRLMPDRGENAVCVVAQGPLFQADDSACCAKALQRFPQGLDALYLAGLPDDCRMEGTGASMADIAWLACADAVVQGARGSGSYVCLTERPDWRMFGERAGLIHVRTDIFMRVCIWMLTELGPSAVESLTSNELLAAVRLPWWHACFSELRRGDTQGRSQEVAWLQAVMRLMRMEIQMLQSMTHTLPLIMRRAKDLQAAVQEAQEHYLEILDTAGRVGLLTYDVEKTGIAQEETVHRGQIKETDAEQARRFLQEARDNLDAQIEAQEAFNRIIGGRALLSMLGTLGNACETEASQVRADCEEAERRIAQAERAAGEEDLERIDQAKSRVMRMRRHLAMLEARAQQVKSDEKIARSAQVHRQAPQLEETDARVSDIFYPEALLSQVLEVEKQDRKTRRKTFEGLQRLWPEGHLEQIRDGMKEKTAPYPGAAGLLQMAFACAKSLS